MEAFRWVLLAIGVVFVLVIYFVGRNRRRRNDSPIDDFEDDLPEFSARHLDDVDEGVGEVRIVTNDDFDDELEYDKQPDSYDDYQEAAQPQPEKAEAEDKPKPGMPSDIIVLYILPKGDNELLGAHINSSAQAMGLKFGDMNIFHYRPGNRNIFSLANMLEPGSFDADSIHDMRTTGLTIFMQISGDDPLDDLTEMLQRSYQLAGLLNARLCNSRRQPLTEQDAENYRTQVREFIAQR